MNDRRSVRDRDTARESARERVRESERERERESERERDRERDGGVRVGKVGGGGCRGEEEHKAEHVDQTKCTMPSKYLPVSKLKIAIRLFHHPLH